MGKFDETRSALEAFAAKVGPHQTALYTVIDYDDEDMTCEARDEDDIDQLIRIAPIVTEGQSMLIYPTRGKKILAARLEDSGDWFIAWAEQVDKVKWTIGNCFFESDGQKWTIRNDAGSIKDLVGYLIDAVSAILVVYGNNPDRTKLTQASNLLNALFNA